MHNLVFIFQVNSSMTELPFLINNFSFKDSLVDFLRHKSDTHWL